MKVTFPNSINAIILYSIIFFSSLLFFQLTYADQFSFSNAMIDHILHFTSVLVQTSIILLFLLYLFRKSKKPLLKYAIGTMVAITAIFWLIGMLFSSFIVFSSEKSNERFYFSESNGYKYYIVSERFVASSGSPEFYFYKEKPILLFIKERLRVSDEEITKMGVDPNQIRERFYKIHFAGGK